MSDANAKVSIAINERGRRATAGTRMNSLVGQAAMDDDEFWNHNTWAEEEDGSFHESDEESEAQKDTFDSDFNDSEDDEEEEGKNGQETTAEAEILLEERQQKRRAGANKRKMVDVVSAGRELMHKRKNATQRKRALKGDGVNAGLVLNLPGSISVATKPTIGGRVGRKKLLATIATVNRAASVTAPIGSLERKSSRVRTTTLKLTESEKGSRRGITAKKALRISTINNSIQTSLDQEQSKTLDASTSTKGGGGKRGKRRFSQEELILEAVQTTEQENERWLLSRKRIQNEENSRAEFNKKLIMGERNRDKKVICKSNSKRGMYNTLTYPYMDHIPDLFTRPKLNESEHQLQLQNIKRNNTCVITGKKAKYRDPKTGKSYHDLAAFKELRRRFEAGEKLEQCPILSDEANSKEKQKTSNEAQSKEQIKQVVVPDLDVASFTNKTRKPLQHYSESMESNKPAVKVNYVKPIIIISSTTSKAKVPATDAEKIKINETSAVVKKEIVCNPTKKKQSLIVSGNMLTVKSPVSQNQRQNPTPCTVPKETGNHKDLEKIDDVKSADDKGVEMKVIPSSEVTKSTPTTKTTPNESTKTNNRTSDVKGESNAMNKKRKTSETSVPIQPKPKKKRVNNIQQNQTKPSSQEVTKSSPNKPLNTKSSASKPLDTNSLLDTTATSQSSQQQAALPKPICVPVLQNHNQPILSQINPAYSQLLQNPTHTFVNQPSAIEMASLYAMNLGQQQYPLPNITPSQFQQPPIHDNNTKQNVLVPVQINLGTDSAASGAIPTPTQGSSNNPQPQKKKGKDNKEEENAK